MNFKKKKISREQYPVQNRMLFSFRLKKILWVNHPGCWVHICYIFIAGSMKEMGYKCDAKNFKIYPVVIFTLNTKIYLPEWSNRNCLKHLNVKSIVDMIMYSSMKYNTSQLHTYNISWFSCQMKYYVIFTHFSSDYDNI